MNLRFQPTVVAWLLALCALSFGLAPCHGAKSYQPVFGDPMLESWRWRTYPELSGLDAQCIVEGKDGTIWFGTSNGLWSYDGIEWLRHSKEVGDIVRTVSIQSDGVLYVGGDWGITEFRKGQWTSLFPGFGGRTAVVEAVPIKKLSCGPDGSLWVATSWGALRRQQSTWTLFTDPETAARLRKIDELSFLRIDVLPETLLAKLRPGTHPDNPCDLTEVCAVGENQIWFGSASGAVLCYALDKAVSNPGQSPWFIYDQTDGLVPGQITSMSPVQNGGVWVVHAASEQADVFDGRKWERIQLPIYLPAVGIGEAGGKLLQTRDGVVWLSAVYALYAYREGHWRKYEQPEIPIPSTRNALAQSADGALWFTSSNNETHRVDYQTTRWLTLEGLNFQWESPAGVQWFLQRDGRIVVQDAGRWISYGVEDDLIDTPVALLGTRSGDVWVAGSHAGTAATARFDGRRWTRTLHEDFSFAIDWRAVFESSDGSVWFGAFVDTDGPEKYRDGLLQYRSGKWIHHHQPGRSPYPDRPDDPATLLPPSPNPERPIEKFIMLGESRDGRIWSGRNILTFHDGKKWQEFMPARVRTGIMETMLTTRSGDLWIGTRENGALVYDGKEWQQFQGKDSLVANSVRSLAETTDGSIWASTDRGFSRFDGRAWMPDVLPEQLNLPHEGGDLRTSPSGQLWINRFTLYWMRRAWSKSPRPAPDAVFRTVRHQFQGQSPDTYLTAGAKVVAQPGNLAVLWSGVMPWREPKDARLQFSFRLDDQPWSPFTSEQGHSFFTLPHGQHHLEVRARDADFNVDPTPATLDVVVLPPVWRQNWFILLMMLLGGLVITQSIRVFLEQARLRRAHDELEIRVRQRTAELEAANRELEAFSYSVSHDLRAPLRSIDGFSKVLLEDYAPKLDDEGKSNLHRVRAAAQRMGRLIEDMLKLSRVTRGESRMAPVNLSTLVQEIGSELARNEPSRHVELSVAANAIVIGDGNLLRIAFENLLGNAWKFTSKREAAKIEFGLTDREGQRVYFVRDNGAGFDMAFANKLFRAFERLHDARDFPGTGVGLAIVQRVILRHGGRVWAEASVEGGATFFFTLGEQDSS